MIKQNKVGLVIARYSVEVCGTDFIDKMLLRVRLGGKEERTLADV